MSHASHGGLESAGFAAALALVLAAAAIVYLRGWMRLRAVSVNFIRPWQAIGFVTGLTLIWVAAGSTLAALDHELLTVHMVQHLLLMTAAAPLILAGAPIMAFLHGLPLHTVRTVIDPVFHARPIRRLGKTLARPGVCWVAATVALATWHVPAMFALGLHAAGWHVFEQATFLGTGLLFWWPVVRPWPSTRAADWSIVLYLFLATLPCDILSGFLVFSERIAYPVYLSAPRRFGLSVIDDQQLAGALMWTCVTLVFLVAGSIIATRLLSSQRPGEYRAATRVAEVA